MSRETQSSVGPWNDKLLLAEFHEAMLAEHNRHRERHGSKPLKLCNQLNKYAYDWAQTIAGMDKLIHRSDRDMIYGENLHRDFWQSQGVDEMAALICNDFYDERVEYDFGADDPKILVNVDHFTQMVWYDSSEMGVSIARGASGFVYCVINYNPRGNVTGEFRANVFPAGTIYKPRNIIDSSVFIPPVNKCTKSPFIDIFRKKLTDQHNIYRKRHGVQFLKNADFLNQIAQAWAIHLAQQDFVEDSHSAYGESIYCLVTPDPIGYPTPIEVCKSFVDEGINYNYLTDDEDCKAGHYTQLVWKSSSALGIGIQKAASGNVYVVCNYNPPGNRKGYYAENVFPPISQNKPSSKIGMRV